MLKIHIQWEDRKEGASEMCVACFLFHHMPFWRYTITFVFDF